MSYEIVKSINYRKKDNKIFITSASNNVSPKTFSRWEFRPDSHYSKEEQKNKELYLFRGILGGSYLLDKCVSQNWKYAKNKFYEYCKENNIDTYELLDLAYKKNIEVLRPYYEVFKNYLEEKKEGKYYLKSNLGFITKVNKKNFQYNPYFLDLKECCNNFKKIYNDYSKLSKNDINKYNITIEEYILNKESSYNKNNIEKMKIVDKIIPTNISDAEYPDGTIIYDEEVQIVDMNTVYNDGRVRVVITRNETDSYCSVNTYSFEDQSEAGYCYTNFDVTKKEVEDIGGIEKLVYETITGEQDKFTSYGVGVATGISAKELGIQFYGISK